MNVNMTCTIHGTYPCPCFTAAQPMVPPTFTQMPPPCSKCGWSHTSSECMAPLMPRLSDADVERIAQRVVALLKASS